MTHYHLIYFADNTVYATLKLDRGDAIEALCTYMTYLYGATLGKGFDHSMYSKLQYKMSGMELDRRLMMERDDPLTVGISACDDTDCQNAPIMS